MSELLAYRNILNDIQNFKRSGTSSGADFNIYDTPSHKYFRILFYFGSASEFDINNSSGLLAPTWDNYKKTATTENVENTKNTESKTVAPPYYMHNSAWAYLKLNDENERAEKLEQFVTLLSDINTNSPWYFSTLSGINDALERKVTEDGKLEIENKKLTINCLPDAFDNRIGTLLELYRDVTWSWTNKKEIIPANLRKFDMAVYIFEAPERNWHTTSENTKLNIDTVIDDNDKSHFMPSYKMIEFHDCEFNYNSVKSAWSELNNQTGIAPTYQIDITYSDCYEISYNDIMMRKIGDVITTDMLNAASADKYISISQEDNIMQKEHLAIRTYPYSYNKTWTGKAIEQLAGHLVKGASDWIKQKIIGNIYGFSLTGLSNNINDIVDANIVKSGMSMAQFIREQKNNYNDKHKDAADGNIFDDVVTKPATRKLGNLFSNSTIANNL